MKEAEAQAKRIKEQEKAALQRLQYLRDLQAVVKTPEGVRVMVHLLGEARIMNQVIVFGEPDRSNANEGRRLFGLMMLQDLAQADPEQFCLPAMKIKAE